MLVLPGCFCLVPCVIKVKQNVTVPDIESWKTKVGENPGSVMVPVYTTEAQGKHTLLVCGRGPKTIRNGEDCGFMIDFTRVHAHQK